MPGISDHEAITFQLNFCVNKTSNINLHKVHQYHRANTTEIIKEMDQFSNLFLTNNPYEQSVERNWQQLKDMLLELIEKYVPHKVINPYKNLPWLSKGIKRLMKQRKRLYDHAKCTQHPVDWAAYKKAQNQVNSILGKAHQDYCSHLFDDTFTDNRKRFWSLIKRIRKNYQPVMPLHIGNSLKSTPLSKAEALNHQFYSVFTKENNDIPIMNSETYPAMNNIVFSINGIQSLLKNLKPRKAAGPDSIPTWILKLCSTQIAPILQVIFTQSLNHGILPKDWLTANIIPIYKKGNKHEAANYRPISLTSVCCKLMEHVVFRNIFEHLSNFGIINPHQHGFQPGLSCQTQLILLTDEILNAMDSHYQVDLLLLDFSKAFDTVAHNKLLNKLVHYGIQNSTHKWISAWLTDRTQRVMVEGALSNEVDVVSGVPQGTVLGPLMFLIYINDIDNNIQSSVRLFADDCILYRVIKSLDDCRCLQEDLNHLIHWTHLWQMKLNSDKCVVLNCTKSHSTYQTNYYINDTPLKVVDQHTYLGVTLHKSMSWSHHIHIITNKATRTLNFIKRTLSKCSTDVKATAYCTLVRPTLEYAATVWDPHQSYLIEEVERVQRRAARWVKADYRMTSSVTMMLNDLKWSTLQKRRQESRLSMFFKFLCQDSTPLEIPLHYQYITNYQTRNYHPLHLMIPSSHTLFYLKSYFPRSIVEWNKLPPYH